MLDYVRVINCRTIIIITIITYNIKMWQNEVKLIFSMWQDTSNIGNN